MLAVLSEKLALFMSHHTRSGAAGRNKTVANCDQLACGSGQVRMADVVERAGEAAGALEGAGLHQVQRRLGKVNLMLLATKRQPLKSSAAPLAVMDDCTNIQRRMLHVNSVLLVENVVIIDNRISDIPRIGVSLILTLRLERLE